MYLEIKRGGETQVVPAEPWRRVLMDAANYGRSHDGTKVCATTAIHMSLIASKPYYELTNDEICAKDKMQKFLGEYIEAWNDTPGRTKTEVVDALRFCAFAG